MQLSEFILRSVLRRSRPVVVVEAIGRESRRARPCARVVGARSARSVDAARSYRLYLVGCYLFALRELRTSITRARHVPSPSYFAQCVCARETRIHGVVTRVCHVFPPFFSRTLILMRLPRRAMTTVIARNRFSHSLRM